MYVRHTLLTFYHHSVQSFCTPPFIVSLFRDRTQRLAESTAGVVIFHPFSVTFLVLAVLLIVFFFCNRDYVLFVTRLGYKYVGTCTSER